MVRPRCLALASYALVVVQLAANNWQGVSGYARSMDGRCTCTGACGPSSGQSDNAWCYVSSSCPTPAGQYLGSYYSYCYGLIRTSDCTVCSVHSSGTRNGAPVDLCCIDSSNTCVAETTLISNSNAYCEYSDAAYSPASSTPAPTPSPTRAPTPAPTPGRTPAPTPRPTGSTPSPTTPKPSSSGGCQNDLFSATCAAIQTSYKILTAGLCTISAECDAITCTTPDLPLIGKQTLALDYNACENTIKFTANSATGVLDLDTPIQIMTGLSIVATNKNIDTSCSTYDVVSFNLLLLGPLNVRLASIPIEFPVGPSSCGLPKWIIYAAIGAGVVLLLSLCGCFKGKKKKVKEVPVESLKPTTQSASVQPNIIVPVTVLVQQPM